MPSRLAAVSMSRRATLSDSVVSMVQPTILREYTSMIRYKKK